MRRQRPADDQLYSLVAVMMEKKLCRKCGKLKNRQNFNADKYRPDGLNNHCRTCYGIDRQMRDASYKNNLSPRVNIHGLTFIQHTDSLRQQAEAVAIGLPPPVALYAYWGGLKLSANDIKARLLRMPTLLQSAA